MPDNFHRWPLLLTDATIVVGVATSYWTSYVASATLTRCHMTLRSAQVSSCSPVAGAEQRPMLEVVAVGMKERTRTKGVETIKAR
ncbi:hypothetical protein OBBRIDRAFT_791222 [Obba rivulosa]|uniref:Uncharacterized protein n=1 Tax=Obba rivulosa TaxID=1052685 RepID=A0A8E2B5M8_9APHY|nr:hypothetical protein OBBRIDRAFT_791222 [Obba rivulosa]